MTALRLSPTGGVRARLRVPGDKSISHRALILNAIADGDAEVRGLGAGRDVQATLEALAALSVRVETRQPGVVCISGGANWAASAPIDCGNSGTTARLLIGLLAPRATRPVTLVGDASLSKRPMRRVVDPIVSMGGEIVEIGLGKRLPLSVSGRRLEGRAHRLDIASAQVKSALLLAGLGAEGETSVEEPGASRDHTERMLNSMGAEIERSGSRITIRRGPLQALSIDVPGDMSSAAPFLAWAASGPQNRVVVEAVGLNSTRTGFLEILRRFGAEVEESVATDEIEPAGNVTVSGGQLIGVDVDANLVPRAIDELPLVAVIATQAKGVTRIKGARELRVKESDRIMTIVAGLRQMGAKITEEEDGFTVEGPTRLRGAAIDAGSDHRIGMALAIAAMLADGPTLLSGSEWVNVSYPDFFEQLAACATGQVPV